MNKISSLLPISVKSWIKLHLTTTLVRIGANLSPKPSPSPYDCIILLNDTSSTGAPMVSLEYAKSLVKKNKNLLFIASTQKAIEDTSLPTEGDTIFLEESRNCTYPLSALIRCEAVTKHATCPILLSSFSCERFARLIPALKSKNGTVLVHEDLDYYRFIAPRNLNRGLDFLKNYLFIGSNEKSLKQLKALKLKHHPKALPQGLRSILKSNDNNTRDRLLKSLDIPNDSFVVMAAGKADGRKGIDLFYQTAFTLRQRPNKMKIHFLWIGDFDPESETAQFIAWQNKKTPLSNFTQVPSSADFDKWYQACDLFFLSSRIDPLPIVAQIALSKGVPVVYFKDTGGTEGLSTSIDPKVSERLEINPFDINQAADVITWQFSNRSSEEMKNFCKAAKTYATETFDLEQYHERIDEIIFPIEN